MIEFATEFIDTIGSEFDESVLYTVMASVTAFMWIISKHLLALMKYSLTYVYILFNSKPKKNKTEKQKKTKPKQKKREQEPESESESDDESSVDTNTSVSSDTTIEFDSDDEDDTGPNLRPRAPVIVPFNGDPEDWCHWKQTTRGRLTAMGFGKVLSNSKYVKKKRKKNVQLFSLLEEACYGGVADYMFLSKKQDGNRAWKRLKTEYDGDISTRTNVATKAKDRLHNCVLVPGMEARQYVNSFQSLLYIVQAQEKGYRIHPNEVKYIFLRNIQDPAFESLNVTMQSNIHAKSFEELKREILNHAYKVQSDKKTRRISGGYDTEFHRPLKIRRVQEDQD
jgi:hypothetical protein